MPIFKYRKFISSIGLVCCVLFGGIASHPFPAIAQEEILAPEAVRILDVIKSGRVDAIRLADKQDILKFYEDHNGDFLWVSNGKYTSDAKKVFELIRQSYTHGLNPENYDKTTISQLIDTRFFEEEQKVKAEILLTNAVVKYGGDISGMRVSAKQAGADSSSWSRGIAAYSLLNILSSSSDPEHVLELLAPQDDIYNDLRKALDQVLKQYAEDAQKNVHQISYSGLLRLGQSSQITDQVRKRLKSRPLEHSSEVYDTNLEQAVIDFQKAHGLKADGVIGPRTIKAMNEGPHDQLVKILANLERLRWVRRPLPSRYIEVNIPAMWLKAVDENKTVFEMPVIVGRKKRQTMSFVDEIVGIRFNPSWYVPDTIKKEDYLPELRKNPQALAEKGIAFRVKSEEEGRMVEVSPEDLDWENMTQKDLKSIQMVQGPGAANALGVIRVLMPNRYDIYLHDTNSPNLFQKDDRTLSSGCVRLFEPRRIANFILGKNKNWSEDRLDSYLVKGKTREVNAIEPVPVYLYYFTIWKNKNGELVYGQDIYDLDQELINVLKNNGQIDFPMI